MRIPLPGIARLDSAALSLFLVILTPAIFVWGVNYRLYTPQAIFVSFMSLAALALLVSHAGSKLEVFLSRRPVDRRVIAAIFATLMVTVLWLALSHTLAVAVSRQPGRVLALAACWAALTCVGGWIGFKPINVFLISWACAALLTGGRSVYKFHGDARAAANPPLDLRENISLRRTPNIYLYILESYTDPSLMRDVYGIDTSALDAVLNQHGFVTYRDSYASAPATIGSLTSLFTFGQASSSADVIGGGGNNLVFRTMKSNGYDVGVHYGHFPSFYYYMREQGEYCDFSDAGSMINLFDPFFLMFDQGRGVRARREKALPELVKTTIARRRTEARPLFFVFKGGANHSPQNGGYSYRDAARWVESGVYQRDVARSNRDIADIVHAVVSADPNCVFILMGDHGPWRLRSAWDDVPAGNRALLVETLKRKNLSVRDVADDVFKIFVAIRMPPDMRQDVSFGHALSQSNLFLHIFAAINDSPAPIANRPPSVSRLRGVDIVREGAVIQ